MHLRKLRLSGFKSFVEPTELSIDPGLTGIVGPNGCGKSNLVEALRWVMGESSARQLRGEEMDDVIFGGTATRPARSVAEVTLQLDDAAPAGAVSFDGGMDVEVSRRITRGEGSLYRINGREARARDVHLLFADASTGARSAAMVSQGQIGALIAAKPEQRRAILEEAAGITGLHARRHEAEQRLHAAELNLARVDDVLATLDAQLQNLKKQARQTSRYKSISERLRRTEATLFFAKWQRLETRMVEGQQALAAAEQAVEMAAREAAAATAALDRATEALPSLRRKESEAAAELHRAKLDRDMLDAEERRATEERQARQARLEQIRRDIERESARGSDAAAALQRLDEERAAIVEAQAGEDAARSEVTRRLEAAEREVAALESQAAQLAAEVARNEAGRAALLRQSQEAEERAARLRRQRDQLARDRDAALAASVDPAALADAERSAATAETRAADAGRAAEAAAETAIQARAAEGTAREAVQRLEMELARLRAEERTLAGLLATDDAQGWTPILESVAVEPGFEMALGAALGEDLAAGTTSEAAVYWRSLPAYEAPQTLPAGAESLTDRVAAAPCLIRRLSQVGLVADAAAGEALSAQLLPGQQLVTRDGARWRWDGLTAAPGRATASATRLGHRNRLQALQAELPPLDAAAAHARAECEAAVAAARDAAANERTARDAAGQARTALAQRQQELAKLSQRAAVHASRIAAIDDTEQRIAAELLSAENGIAALRDSVTALVDPAAARAQADSLRAALGEARRALFEARSERDRQERDAAARSRRVASIADEARSWSQRRSDAETHLADLRGRASAEEEALAGLAQLPGDIAVRRNGLSQRITLAEEAKRSATDALAAAEALAAQQQQIAKAAEAALAAAREARVRADAGLENARAASATLLADIRERFGRSPDTLVDLREEETEDPEAIEQRLARLQREREGIGPVNLRADVEIETTTAEIAELVAQREDLTAAIAKLRAGIAELNREARGRLSAAFEQVDGHFRHLFTRLFGGGRAELALTDTDDPLSAGLDILASPPCKRLENLALLSGGERALAALSLILAVFLTQPAPICVLDEVDAPLDDANVDRFCSLIEEIAETTGTRFLVVTHHPLTMARMHRLFGVTMAERGISQLVSVDLRLAEELRATA